MIIMGILSIKVERPWTPLKKGEIYDVHMASIEILEKIGIRIFDEEALGVYKEAGGIVDHKDKRVKIPQYLVEEALKKAPSQVTLCGREPQCDIKIGDRRVHFTVCSEALSVTDLRTGSIRPATKQDLSDLTKLADALGYCTMIPSVCPQDVPQAVWLQHAVQAMLNNTEKHITFLAPPNGEGARDIVNMATAVTGGVEELRRRPLISGGGQLTSPLKCMAGVAQAIIEFAKQGIPVTVGSVPLAGATSPVTLAGTLAQMNAETLAGLVLVQLINPGLSFIYGSAAPCIMDMRTGNVSIGCPEKALVGSALAQLTQYYRLPNLIDGFSPDSKFNDTQVGYEKTTSVLAIALAGADIIMGAGLLQWGDICCYDSFVIDNEIAGYVHRVLKGINVCDETLAVDVIDKVGPIGHFLKEKHTMVHLKNEHFIPEVTDRYRRATWERLGSKTLERRANEKAITILKTHHPKLLDKDIQQEISKIVREAEEREIKRS